MTDTTIQRSQSPILPKKRISLRMLVFLAVICLPVAWMTYTFVKLSVSAGIEQVGEYKQVDLKSMGNFVFDERVDDERSVPEVYRKLDGQKVLLIGQMYVDFSAEATVDRFQLVYSIQKCCFNGPPRVQERVFAHAPPGSTMKLPVFDGQVAVYGTLHIRAIKEKGYVVSLFDMDVERMGRRR